MLCYVKKKKKKIVDNKKQKTKQTLSWDLAHILRLWKQKTILCEKWFCDHRCHTYTKYE